MKARFANFKNLKFISLVNENKSQNLACQVDSDAFERLEKNYGNFFDIIRLKADLAGIYNAYVFQDKSVTNLPDFIFEKERTQKYKVPRSCEVVAMNFGNSCYNSFCGEVICCFKK